MENNYPAAALSDDGYASYAEQEDRTGQPSTSKVHLLSRCSALKQTQVGSTEAAVMLPLAGRPARAKHARSYRSDAAAELGAGLVCQGSVLTGPPMQFLFLTSSLGVACRGTSTVRSKYAPRLHLY